MLRNKSRVVDQSRLSRLQLQITYFCKRSDQGSTGLNLVEKSSFKSGFSKKNLCVFGSLDYSCTLYRVNEDKVSVQMYSGTVSIAISSLLVTTNVSSLLNTTTG